MKMSEALDIIEGSKKENGFRVLMERVDGIMLRAAYFPEDDEEGIRTEDEAWELANRFAEKK